MTTDYLTIDQDCDDCGANAAERTCDGCGARAIVTDCGHYDQPRPIAALGNDMACEDCAVN